MRIREYLPTYRGNEASKKLKNHCVETEAEGVTLRFEVAHPDTNHRDFFRVIMDMEKLDEEFGGKIPGILMTRYEISCDYEICRRDRPENCRMWSVMSFEEW